MGFVEQGVGSFPKFDPMRVHIVEADILRGSLGEELRDPKYSQSRARAFSSIVAETIVLASDVAQVPGVRLEAGDGVTDDGRACIARAEIKEDEGVVIFSRDYLFAHLAKDVRQLTPYHVLVHRSHPSEITAHEIWHIRQLLEEPDRIDQDLAYSIGNSARWESTFSERDAQSFAGKYMERVRPRLSFTRRRNHSMFTPKNSFK